MKDKPVPDVRWLRPAWPAVFAANLIIPLDLGWSVTREGGRAGMFAAMALLWLLGHVVCGRSRGLGLVLIGGSVLVAISQCLPSLQFLAGMFSLRVGKSLGLTTDDQMSTTGELGGFVVTLMTGGLLIVAAAVFGLGVRGFFALIGWADRSEKGVTDDRERESAVT